jgi:hypothetical protein
MITSTVIPFVIMIATSIIIIRMLFKSRNRINKRITQTNTQSSDSTVDILNVIKNTNNNSRRDHQFAKTVIILNLLFLICNLPICILLIIWNYYSFSEVYIESELKLCYSIFSIFIYCYSALPFFIYLKVNTVFRSDFLLTMKNFKENLKKYVFRK